MTSEECVVTSGDGLVNSEVVSSLKLVTSGDGVVSCEEVVTSWKLEVISEGGVVWIEVGFIVGYAVLGWVGTSEKVELTFDGTVEDVFTVCSVAGRVMTVGEKVQFCYKCKMLSLISEITIPLCSLAFMWGYIPKSWTYCDGGC